MQSMDFLAISPTVILSVAVVMLFMVDVTFKVGRRWWAIAATLGLVGATVASAWQWVEHSGDEAGLFFSDMLAVDGFSSFAGMVIFPVAGLGLMAGWGLVGSVGRLVRRPDRHLVPDGSLDALPVHRPLPPRSWEPVLPAHQLVPSAEAGLSAQGRSRAAAPGRGAAERGLPDRCDRHEPVAPRRVWFRPRLRRVPRAPAPVRECVRARRSSQ